MSNHSHYFPKFVTMQNLPEPETDDYYINNLGLMVFTEKYHLKRGYCCNNNCLHCPYKEEKKNNNNYGSDKSTKG